MAAAAAAAAAASEANVAATSEEDATQAGIEAFVGTWKNVEAEGMDGFLYEMGVGYMMRTLASTMGYGVGKQMLEIRWDAATKTITITNRGRKISTVSGAFGAPIKAAGLLGGEEGTVTFSMHDGGKTFVANVAGGKTFVVKRTIEDGKMVQKMTLGSSTATRVYERLEGEAAAAAVAAANAAAEK